MGTTTLIKYQNGSNFQGQVKAKMLQNSEDKQDVPEGKGCITFADGNRIQGWFIDGILKNGFLQAKDFTYEGQFSNQAICGMGVLTDRTNCVYQGHFQSGELKKGKIIKKTNKSETFYQFQGQITDSSKMNATGQLRISRKQAQQDQYVIYKVNLKGQIINGRLNGRGKYELSNGDLYEGQFQNGILHGQVFYKSYNIQLKGRFYKNVPDGEVKMTFSNKDQYEGEMKEGKMHGTGKYIYSNGIIYQGRFYHGQQWGKCKIKYPNQAIQSYEGDVISGIYEGIGVIYYSNGVIFKGFFQKGLKNGFGVLIYGKKKYKCLYILNKLVGELKDIDNF